VHWDFLKSTWLESLTRSNNKDCHYQTDVESVEEKHIVVIAFVWLILPSASYFSLKHLNCNNYSIVKSSGACIRVI
jgi:hypothetical protein